MSDVARRVVPAMLLGRVLAFSLPATTLPVIMRCCRVASTTFDAVDVIDAIRAVERVWRVMPRGSGTCLTRSVWRVFAGRRAGLPLQFVIGVRLTSTKQLEAHAWLELKGALFREGNAQTPVGFTRLFEHPSTSASSAPVPAELRFG